MAEYLSEEEQLAQLKGWWQRYGWWLLAAVVLGLGGYFAMQYLQTKANDVNAAASEVFERYQEVAADEAAAKPLLARLDGEFAGTAYQVMALLTRGQQATDAGDIDAALGFYQSAVDGPNVEHITDVARLRLARGLQQQGKSEQAVTVLGAVAGEGYRSLVAELKGDILRAQGKASAAREAYAAAVEAQGENPRTLLQMKLADLSAPAGTANVGDTVVELVGNEDAGAESEVDEAASAANAIDAAVTDAAATDADLEPVPVEGTVLEVVQDAVEEITTTESEAN